MKPINEQEKIQNCNFLAERVWLEQQAERATTGGFIEVEQREREKERAQAVRPSSEVHRTNKRCDWRVETVKCSDWSLGWEVCRDWSLVADKRKQHNIKQDKVITHASNTYPKDALYACVMHSLPRVHVSV